MHSLIQDVRLAGRVLLKHRLVRGYQGEAVWLASVAVIVRCSQMDAASLDKRRHTRQPISLSALVHPAQGRSWLCTIRDFCEEGMLLTGTGGSRSLAATGAEARAGDQISLHFSVASPEGQKHFRTQAKIARVLESGSGMGVRFENGLPDNAFNSLVEFAIASGMLSSSSMDEEESADADAENGEQTAGAAKDVTRSDPRSVDAEISEKLSRDRHIEGSDADEIRKKMCRVTQRSLDRVCTQFFANVDAELLVKARDAGSNAVQMMYFEALDMMEQSRDQIRDDFISEVLRQIDQISKLDDVLERRRLTTHQILGNAPYSSSALPSEASFTLVIAEQSLIRVFPKPPVETYF